MTTHELGHNFGAEHDPDNVLYCAPREDQGGKYVMYPIAVGGDHVNNKVTTRTGIWTGIWTRPDTDPTGSEPSAAFKRENRPGATEIQSEP